MMKNPANRILLWLFLLPSGMYQKMGVDLAQLKAILTAKLTIDDRRATGLQKARRQNPDKEISTATLFTILTALLMGATLLVSFILQDDLTRMTFYFGCFGFILSMFLITDFSDILIDPKDNYIILPKPISSVTFTVARLIHLLIHITKIVIPLSFPGFVGFWISRGIWGAIGFVILIPFLTLFAFVLVNTAYLFIVRVFSPGKLNNIITSMQIVFSVILYGSYQLLPRLIDQSDLQNLVLYTNPLFWLIPSYWFAKGWIFLHSLSLEPGLIAGIIVSIGIPLVGLWLVIRFLAPAFFRKLSLIHTEALSEKQVKKNELKRIKLSADLSSRLSRLFTRTGLEREAFLFTWKMTGRSRDFKMRVYPQFGYMLVLLVIFSFRSWSHIQMAYSAQLYAEDSQIKILVLSLIYVSCFLFMGAMLQLPYSDYFRAAWIYLTSPVQHPGAIIRGAIKACLSKFFLSIVLLVTLLGLFLFGTSVLPNLLFGFGNVLLMCSIFSWLAMDRFPFSISIKTQVRGEITSRNMFMLIALPFFGIPHYFLFNHPVIMSSISVFTITAAFVILYFTKNISWKYIKDV